jgi:hypothetical protein
MADREAHAFPVALVVNSESRTIPSSNDAGARLRVHVLLASSARVDRSTVMNEPPTNDQSKNEGEGNRTADRRYCEGVRRHVESGTSQPAAEEAEHALEGAEADQLREAEEKGKRPGPG